MHLHSASDPGESFRPSLALSCAVHRMKKPRSPASTAAGRKRSERSCRMVPMALSSAGAKRGRSRAKSKPREKAGALPLLRAM